MGKHERFDAGGDRIYSQKGVDCPRCKWNARLEDFKPFLHDRAGLKVVRCSCPVCFQKWKRVDVSWRD